MDVSFQDYRIDSKQQSRFYKFQDLARSFGKIFLFLSSEIIQHNVCRIWSSWCKTKQQLDLIGVFKFGLCGALPNRSVLAALNTFPSLWRPRSAQRDITTMTEQTTATTHVGVCSSELDDNPSAISWAKIWYKLRDNWKKNASVPFKEWLWHFGRQRIAKDGGKEHNWQQI